MLAAILNTRAADNTHATLPSEVKRVLFLGDSITYGGLYTAYVEAYFATRQPDRNIEFINAGLPSETVSGLSEKGHADGKFPRPDLKERLGRVLEQTNPDLVYACYGINDGIYMPYSYWRARAFKNGMKDLRKTVRTAKANIIHLTPAYYDGAKSGNLAYIDTLDRYSKWLMDQREKGWEVADIYGTMGRYLKQRRLTEPNFALAGDAVHPNDTGHWLMAKTILLHLGARDIGSAENAQQMVAVHPQGEKILSLVKKREEMMRDAWLTATGHKRPGIGKGLPMSEAKAKAEEIGKQIAALQQSKSSQP